MSLEHILRVPLDAFIGRDATLALVKQALSEAQPGQLHLLTVKGSSGSGKTALLSYVADYICPQLQWRPVPIRFAQGRPDFSTLLLQLEIALEALVQRTDFSTYRAQKYEIHQRYQKNRLELVNKRRHPHVQGGPQMRSDELHFTLWAEVQQLRASLCRVLCQLAQQNTAPLCLLLDDYDHLLETEGELIGWLWEDLLGELTRCVSYPIAVIVCGKQWADDDARKHSPQHKIRARDATLKNFDLFGVKNYLAKKLVLDTAASLAEQGELISLFYELTQGHPLSLELALVYFKTFEREERTAANLRAHIEQANERAYLKTWLDRLLIRLPEPHRTLLERGPILRTCTPQTLQVLLDVMSKGAPDRSFTLDEQTYRHFLLYPFFDQPGAASNREQPLAFHALLRRVRLQMLRHQSPQLHQQLQLTMMEFYALRLSVFDQERQTPPPLPPLPEPRVRRRDKLMQWIRNEPIIIEEPAPRVLSLKDKVEAPDTVFEAVVEYLYHALQLKEIQSEVFMQWRQLLESVIESGQRQRAGQLWEIVRQLSAEDELFLKKPAAQEGYTLNNPYTQYNKLYNEYIEYDAQVFAKRR